MASDKTQDENLRNLLENILQSDQLDTHPWVDCLIVQQACADNPLLFEKKPGQRLVQAVGKLFAGIMPATPPRQGKRLDTRWGEFGILAAQYFAPLLFGAPSPASLREAWGRIDQSILLFVYGKSEETLAQDDILTFKLVRDEPGVAANSTLSDWNRKGTQRLLEVIISREQYLSEKLNAQPVITRSRATNPDSSSGTDPGKTKGRREKKDRLSGRRRLVFLILGLSLLGLLLAVGLKGWRIYDQAMLLRQDVVQLQNLLAVSGSKIDKVRAAGPILTSLTQDFEVFKAEIDPFLWLGPMFAWVPTYGGDLAAIKDLMTLADSLIACADLSFQAASPFLAEEALSSLTPTELTEELTRVHPQLLEAQRLLEQAVIANDHLAVANLTPEVHDLILNDISPLMAMLQDGLTIALEFPTLMGATNEGPKTYLLLVQNEDELRPTGGFITAVGTVLVEDGQIRSMTFRDSGGLEDWTKPYPAAPWQLSQYMNSPVLVLRDTSWFTNFPTAALYAESLYSYVSEHSVDGVIAFDQQMLVELLAAIGPIELEGAPYPLDSSNIIAFMRIEKARINPSSTATDWSDKDFMLAIADVLMAKLYNGEVSLESLVEFIPKALNEHHLLVQLDNPAMTSLLGRYRWDGVVQPEEGDFLMVVDSNIGFNKTNAIVYSSQLYEVDLTHPLSPTGSLTVVHTNDAAEVICNQWNKIRFPGERGYPITDCYWNYLRLYMVEGTRLLEADPQFVPANWMILRQDVPAKVDILDEGIEGVQSFGTLQVVPGNESLSINFRFSLPARILEVQPVSSFFTYHLLVQKQPGTLAVPFTLRVILPEDAPVLAMSNGAVREQDTIVIQTDLRIDREFEIVFEAP